MKPKTSLFPESIKTAAFFTAVTLCVAGYSRAAELNWNTTTGDFNTAANWLVGAGPGTGVPGTLDNANVANGGIAQYTTNAAITVAEVRAGNGAAGAIEISGGNTFTSSGSVWAGRQSGSATGSLTVSGTGTIFNINAGNTLVGAGASGVGVAANGSTGILNINSGAVYNHNPTGADTFRIGDTQGVAGNAGNYSGTLNVNGGTLNLPGARLYVGQSNANGTSTGVVNLSNNSAINVNNNWVIFGRFGGTGTLNMSGGTFTKAGANEFALGDNAGATGTTTSTFTHTGGTLSITGGQFFVGNGGNTNATYTLSGTGSTTVNNWIAVGRNGANGTLTMTGGTITKTGNATNNVTIGTGGGTNQGIVNISGGLFDVQIGEIFVGEGSLATVNLSGTGEIRSSGVRIAVNNTANLGVLNLNGGTLKTSRIYGGAGNSAVAFNGSTVQATASQTAFLDNLDLAEFKSGGAIIDTNGFDLGVATTQPISGAGGVTKQGLGTLSLLGANSYAGATVVTAGKLVTSTSSTGTGAITVASSATFALHVASYLEAIHPAAMTLGAAALDINLNATGNTGVAPVDVTGTLTVNGGAATIPINLTGTNLYTGQFPVIKYASLAGSGGFSSFKVGTLPLGVTATLVNNTGNNSIDLSITVKSPVWNGYYGGDWNTTTANWEDAVTALATTYADGDPVLFADLAPDAIPPYTTDVTLASGVTVRPGALVQFNNSLLNYTLTGAGKISNPVSGTVGLTKQGSGSLTIGTTNDFTGVTRIEGGTLSVAALANGGVASPIGASTSAPASLVLAGGTLSYTGATAGITRGFTVGGDNGGIEVTSAAANLTFSGSLASTAGGLVKKGPGTLTLTGTGTNSIGAGAPVRVEGGKLAIIGTGATPAQVVNSAGDIWVGSSTTAGASMDITGGTVSSGGWLAVGRGNGDGGNISTLNVTGSTLSIGNFSTGYANGLPNLATQNITIANSTFNNTGNSVISENGGSTTNINVTGNSVLNFRELQLALGGATSAATLTIGGTSIVKLGTDTIHSYASIGRNGGTGTLTVKDSGSITNYDDFTLGEQAGSNGTGIINLQDSGTITIDTGLFGRGANNTGIINQTGGTFSSHDLKDFQIGVNGTATWNLSAGTVNSLGWTSIARFGGSTGTLNVSGGTYNQTRADRAILVGEEGNGTLNLSGTGIVNTGLGLRVGWAASATGTVTQTGGTANISANVTLGNGNNAQGTYTISAGTLNVSTLAGSNLIVGNADTSKGTLNVSAAAVVKLHNNASIRLGNGNTNATNIVTQSGGTITAYSDAGTTVGGTGAVILGSATATGTNTYNLAGGTLTVAQVTSAGSTSLFNFQGGTLKAAADSTSFLSNITVASIETAGANIDSNGHNVTITSALADAGGGGGITKTGTGTLTLAGQNTYLGNTAINAGGVTLADDARLRFFIGANGVTNRITGTGTATLDGDFNLELAGAAIANGNSWTLVNGSVSKSFGASFTVIGFTESANVWTKIDGTKTWTFSEATGVLSLSVGTGTAYDTWTSTYFPGVTNPAVIGATADPDGDGSTNALEFALGGVPNNGANGPKVYALQADTSADVDANKEQLLTIAVRSSVTPAFSAAASPTATTSDNLTVYTIQGTLDLATFTSPVTVVSPAITTGLPAAPSGYEYRTFSLNNSNGLTGKGFLRAKVN